jgi:hypothetical protein
MRVARATHEDPAGWLGAALPDLQREAGVSIGSLHSWSEPVRVGIQCHHATDDAFHDLPAFLHGSRSLTRDLLDRGVPRGAARAVGHAGWELLLDGSIVDDAELIDGYFAAMSVEVTDSAWRAALDRRIARGVPEFYARPEGVAELLRRILSYRPRLSFGAEHLDAVTDALRLAQPAIVDAADAVFAAVTPAAR